MLDGNTLGFWDGAIKGDDVGNPRDGIDGTMDGFDVGVIVGGEIAAACGEWVVGSKTEGPVEGLLDGLYDGLCDGASDGDEDGSADGCSDGFGVGFPLAASLLTQ